MGYGNPLTIAADFWKKKAKAALKPIKGQRNEAGGGNKNQKKQLDALKRQGAY